MKKLAKNLPLMLLSASALLSAESSFAQMTELSKKRNEREESSAVNVDINSQIRIAPQEKSAEDKNTAKGIEQLKIDQDLQNLTNSNPLFYEKAVFAFETRGEAGITPLVSYLKSNKNDEKIVTAVVYTFGRIGPAATKAVPMIVPYLKNKNRDIRGTAVAALGKVGRAAEPTISLIKDMLFDEDEWVGERAYRALVDINTEKARKIAKDYKKLEDQKKKRLVLEGKEIESGAVRAIVKEKEVTKKPVVKPVSEKDEFAPAEKKEPNQQEAH